MPKKKQNKSEHVPRTDNSSQRSAECPDSELIHDSDKQKMTSPGASDISTISLPLALPGTIEGHLEIMSDQINTNENDKIHKINTELIKETDKNNPEGLSSKIRENITGNSKETEISSTSNPSVTKDFGEPGSTVEGLLPFSAVGAEISFASLAPAQNKSPITLKIQSENKEQLFKSLEQNYKQATRTAKWHYHGRPLMELEKLL